jgi:FkbM family methyltransferase
MIRNLISQVVEFGMPFRMVATHTIFPQYLPDDGIVLDFGANRGMFSKWILESTHCRCYAIEANPSLANRLEPRDRFKVINAAVAGRARTVKLVLDENPECSSILTGVVDHEIGTVEIGAIDYPTALSELGVTHVDLLKLDIEGAEIELFDSMTDAQIQAILQITVEFHDDFGWYPKEEARRVSRRLGKLGFTKASLWGRRTFDTVFLNTKHCPGARWAAFRTSTLGRIEVAIFKYLEWRLATQRGVT